MTKTSSSEPVVFGELTDDEVLTAAVAAGTFEFWNCPEDERYDKPG